MKSVISRFTMKKLDISFMDVVDGKIVYKYVDKYGKFYLANYPFYLWSFRVKI